MTNVVHFEFVELESDASFTTLANLLGGTLSNNAILFDNELADGALIQVHPEEGLWVRKWKFTVRQKLMMHRLATPETQNSKFSLVYFLNPSIFHLEKDCRQVMLNNRNNNLLLSNRVAMDFSVVPRQPFCIVDVTFTKYWLYQQLSDAAPALISKLEHCLSKATREVVISGCLPREVRSLCDLDAAIDVQQQHPLLIRARVYDLVTGFLHKTCTSEEQTYHKNNIQFEQAAQAEAMIRNHLFEPLKVSTIAQRVNLSVSSLNRQFKALYGKSVGNYYVEARMQLAKKLMTDEQKSVGETALLLGYRHASPFIETFTKQCGFSPGNLKEQL